MHVVRTTKTRQDGCFDCVENERPPAWRRRGLLILAICLAGVAAVIILNRPAPEPVYRGRPLRVWVEALGSIQTSTQFEDDPTTAILQIGTNGIPFLLKWVALDTRPSFVKRMASELSSKLPPRTVSLKIRQWADRPSPVGPLAAGAVKAFGVLGERATSGSPRLARLARSSSREGPRPRQWTLL